MNNWDEEVKRQIEEVKLLDQDLYEEDFDEVEAEDQKPINTPFNKQSKAKKLIIGTISLLLLLTIIGPLAETFNIAAIQFLKKSYELSQRTDIQAYKKAVVNVKVDDKKGTGFNISSSGIIITNYHIVENEDKAIIHFPDGPTERAKIVKKLPEMDIALLKLDNQSDLPFLHIDKSSHWKEGDHIFFIGNPLMFNQIANEGEIIGATNNAGLSTPAIVIDAPVYKGNSGSPLINENGEVIGVIFAKGSINISGEKTKAGFAIPIDAIPKEFLDK